jgi:hypothetical protein
MIPKNAERKRERRSEASIRKKGSDLMFSSHRPAPLRGKKRNRLAWLFSFLLLFRRASGGKGKRE